MKIITYDEVVEKVTEIVNERGRDYVYDEAASNGDCSYFINDAPSCVVGHWVHALDDLEIETAIMDHESNTGVFPPSMFMSIFEKDGVEVEIESDAIRFLTWIQIRQDMRDTWGNALDFALDQIESGEI